MSLPNGHPLRPVNGRNGAKVPGTMVTFSAVAELLRKRDAATAFTQAAETLLDHFNDLKAEMGAAAVIKLAIDCHKHGLFCEVAADKTRSQHDAAAYDAYQKYLSGESDTPVAVGLPGIQADDAGTTVIDVDRLEDSDAEEE